MLTDKSDAIGSCNLKPNDNDNENDDNLSSNLSYKYKVKIWDQYGNIIEALKERNDGDQEILIAQRQRGRHLSMCVYCTGVKLVWQKRERKIYIWKKHWRKNS